MGRNPLNFILVITIFWSLGCDKTLWNNFLIYDGRGCTPAQTACLMTKPSTCSSMEVMAANQDCGNISNVSSSFFDADMSIHKDADILFVIDNSFSMTSKQKSLASNIGKFIRTIDNAGINYHLGVTTSDVGSTIGQGMFWSSSEIQTCNSFSGDDGILQTRPCTQRGNQSSDARNTCNSICTNPTFSSPPSPFTDGNLFLSKINGTTNVPIDMKPDPMAPGKMVDMGPIEAFQCIALVGDGGCGIEAPLESAKRALDGHRTENARFLRSGSVLALIFITDEDDCSVQLSRRAENTPNTNDCPNADYLGIYNCYNYDYRCLATSISCDQAMNTAGPKTNCHERPDNYLEPIENYYDFFSNLRNPTNLSVSGIWTMPPVNSGGPLTTLLQGTGNTSPFLNRGDSCTSTMDPSVSGKAQLRLSKFASMFKNSLGQQSSIEISICDTDKYVDVLDRIAQEITYQVSAACLPVIPRKFDGQPQCVVGDVDAAAPNDPPETLLTQCSTACCAGWAGTVTPNSTDPKVQAACMSEAQTCYCAVPSTVPGVCPGTAVAGVWRTGTPPAGKLVNFRCAG